MIKRYIAPIFERIVQKNVPPNIVARSCAIGTFMAFSPYIGLQTWLIFPACLLLRARVMIAMIVLYTVNNPWTMIPIWVTDYLFGYWLTEVVLKLNLSAYDPAWMAWINQKLNRYLAGYVGDAQLCLWCFLLGGTIIAFACGAVAYPLSYRMYERFLKRRKQSVD